MDIKLGWSDRDNAYVVHTDHTAPTTDHDLRVTLSDDEAIGFVLVASSQSPGSWLQLDPDATSDRVLARLDDYESTVYRLPESSDIVPGGLLLLARDSGDMILDGFIVTDVQLIDRTLVATRP